MSVVCVFFTVDTAGINLHIYDKIHSRCGCNIPACSTVVLETCDPCAEFRKRMEAKKKVQAREA